MTAHPELRELSSVNPTTRGETYQSFAAIFTRLLSENCPREARAVIKTEGGEALGKAFESLGRLAIQELMTNTEVQGAIGAFEKFVDRPKVESVLRQD
jgi:hypothetical protein